MAVSTTIDEQAVIEDRIRRRAYEFYEERMVTGTVGNDLHDWLTAEAEIHKQIAAEPHEPAGK